MSIRAGVVALLLLVGVAGTGLGQVRRGPQPGPGPMGPNANNQAGGEAAAVAGGMLCLIAVGAIIGIGIKVFIIIFIVTDAKKRDMDPTLYVILEVFLGLIGLIVYLCSRQPLVSERGRYAREYDGDEDDDDRIRRSRRYRHRDDGNDERGRRKEWDY
jgi:hypothetical protein